MGESNGYINLYFGVAAPTPYMLESIKYTPPVEGVALVQFNTPKNLHARKVFHTIQGCSFLFRTKADWMVLKVSLN